MGDISKYKPICTNLDIYAKIAPDWTKIAICTFRIKIGQAKFKSNQVDWNSIWEVYLHCL